MMSRRCPALAILLLVLGVLPRCNGYLAPLLRTELLQKQHHKKHRMILVTVVPFHTTTILHSTTDSSDDKGGNHPAEQSVSLTTTTTTTTTSIGDLEEPTTIGPRPEFAAGSDGELLYALGVNLARQLGDIRPLVETGEELAQLAKGLLDSVIGRLSDEGQRELLQRRAKDLNDLVATRAQCIHDELAKAGRTMLQEMAQTEGAITLEGPSSGVVLHVLERSSSGVRPTKSSTVTIHYHGTLADGTVFDSTLSGEPVQLPLANVIPGWRDAVLKMHEGETAMVGIPPEHAYGESGTPDGRIPANSTIFFKVMLLEVLSAGIGGSPTLYGGDGRKLSSSSSSRKATSSGLLGADGRPM